MMTIITHVTLREGSEPQWDAAMREVVEDVRRPATQLGGGAVAA